MKHPDPPRRPINRRKFFLGTGAIVGTLTQVHARPSDLPAPNALEQLEAQTRRTLRWAARPPDWVRPRADVDHNVVVVGAGHSGLGIACGLRRKGISRVAVIDAAEPGGAGIWRHIARMHQ